MISNFGLNFLVKMMLFFLFFNFIFEIRTTDFIQEYAFFELILLFLVCVFYFRFHFFIFLLLNFRKVRLFINLYNLNFPIAFVFILRINI
jgi:hypothetical protein